jgi:hypothetical protein
MGIIENAAAEKSLARYLETETLLNGFFAAFNYCLENCILPLMDKNGGRPVAACCQNRYHCLYDLGHPAYDLLRAERERRYGRPEDQVNPAPVSPCEYHGPRGCRLTTHKSPICLAFMCRESIETLREKHGVFTYDYLGVYYALEWILTGDFPEVEYRGFRDDILDMTERVKGRRRVRQNRDCSENGA